MLFTTHQIFVIFKAQPNAMLSVWTWLANVLKAHLCRKCKKDIFWRAMAGLQAPLSSICTGWTWGWKAQERTFFFALICKGKEREKYKYLLLLVDTNTSKTCFVNFPKMQFFWFALGLKIFQTKSQFHHWRADHCSLKLTWGGKVDKGHWETDKADYAQECVTTTQCKRLYNSQFPSKCILQNTIQSLYCIRYKQLHSAPVGLIVFLSAVVNNCMSTEHWAHFTLHINTCTVQRLLLKK